MPHVQDRPLVLAIAAFHAHDATLFSPASIAQYLYAVQQVGALDAEGRLDIQTTRVDGHSFGAKTIPSGFFFLPDAEHISAVLFTNAGTVSKFTRMGYQAGLHRGNVLVRRVGVALNHDPDALEPIPFEYALDEDVGEEPWGSGVHVFHNPRAVHPVPEAFFEDASETWWRDDAPVSSALEFTPLTSTTIRIRLDSEWLVPVEECPRGVGTIRRAEFESHEPVRLFPPGEAPFHEVAWFADRERRVLGTVLQWHENDDYGFVILGRDERGRWRRIELESDLPSLDGAAERLVRRMEHLSATGKFVFPQGD